ncbi:MAG: DUF2254 domain-containing protein [Kiloniellaceae bacterium]
MPLASPGETLFPVLKNEFRRVRTALWFRPGALCIVAALAAALLATIDGILPPGSLVWLPEVEVATVKELMKLLAGSMLTVATVTLSVIMLVLSLAAGQASPRAVPEIMGDPVTQNALSTFLATFVYALTALMLFGFGAVERSGVTLSFLGALLLVLNAVRYLVQWIHHVAEILKINHIIARIHRQARTVLKTYLNEEQELRCGERLAVSGEPRVIRPTSTGYVQLIDADRLHQLACEHDLVVQFCVQEGDFVHPHCRLMEIHGNLPGEDALAALRANAVVGFERSHEGDPRFGFELLAEVACRALSPGVNDPQSALACINYLGALLAMAGATAKADYPSAVSADGRVASVRPDFAAMLERAYRPVMRDGAGSAEVICAIMAVLKDLTGLVATDYLEALVGEAERAEAFGKASLTLDVDKQALARLTEALREVAASRANAGR